MTYVTLNDCWFKNRLNDSPLSSFLDWQSIFGRNHAVNLVPRRGADMKFKNFSRLKKRFPEKVFERTLFFAIQFRNFFCRIFPGARSIVNTYLDQEWLLYAEAGFENYRDHFIHPVKVGYVGDMLMRMKISDNDVDFPNPAGKHSLSIPKEANTLFYRLIECFKKSSFTIEIAARAETCGMDNPVEKIFITAWWLSALAHDLGYPLTFLLQRIEPDLEDGYPVFQGHNLSSLLDFIARSDGTSSRPNLLAKRIMELFGVNRECVAPILCELMKTKHLHGVHGAINLLGWREEVNSLANVGKPLYIAVELAACAIFNHDLVGIHEDDPCLLPRLRKAGICVSMDESPKVDEIFSMEKDPLSWLLVLSDMIQEWGRPQLKKVESSSEEDSVPVENSNLNRICFEFMEKCKEVKISHDNSQWKIKAKGMTQDSTKNKNIITLLKQWST